jgi:ABC-type Zn2+ transport system substrate-binding protein/surface adhesin
MTNALLTKVAIAAAATMLTLTPALADRNDHRHNNKSHHVERSHGDNHYGNYRSKRHAHGHRHHHRPYWMKRFYGWNYGYKPNRRWW